MDYQYWRQLSARVHGICRQIEALRNDLRAAHDHEGAAYAGEPLPGLWALMEHADRRADQEARNEAAS